MPTKFDEGMPPAVSILMGVYQPVANLAALRASVESMLCQTFADFEFLICDDGSCWEVKNCLEQIAQQDSRIRLVRKGTALSLPQKLNVCLAQAQGQWIARQDDDDISFPERLERELAFLHDHPHISFVGCNVEIRMADGTIGERTLPKAPTVRDFFFVMPFVHPTLLLKRACLLAVNGYSEDSFCILCEDYDLLLRLYQQGFVGENLPDVLFSYYVSDRPRKYRYRINEAVTRYRRFSEMKLLPGGFPYVMKPLLVGLISRKLLESLKWKKGIYHEKRH